MLSSLSTAGSASFVWGIGTRHSFRVSRDGVQGPNVGYGLMVLGVCGGGAQGKVGLHNAT